MGIIAHKKIGSEKNEDTTQDHKNEWILIIKNIPPISINQIIKAKFVLLALVEKNLNLFIWLERILTW